MSSPPPGANQKAVEAGYQSNSASFRQTVSKTLNKSGQFERVGRGRYTARMA
jgi:hypothetical protein